MAAFQKDIGAVPPGVKGLECGGRRQHSTNWNVEEPALNACANASTITPKAQSKGSSKSSSSLSGSMDIHHQSLSGFSKLSSHIENLIKSHHADNKSRKSGSVNPREEKRRRLLDVKKNHMETVTFLSSLPTPSQQTKLAYEKVLDAMIKTNEEIVKLDNELANETE